MNEAITIPGYAVAAFGFLMATVIGIMLWMFDRIISNAREDARDEARSRDDVRAEDEARARRERNEYEARMREEIKTIYSNVKCVGTSLNENVAKIESHLTTIVDAIHKRIGDVDRRHGDRGSVLAERVRAIEARCEAKCPSP